MGFTLAFLFLVTFYNCNFATKYKYWEISSEKFNFKLKAKLKNLFPCTVKKLATFVKSKNP